MNDYIPYQDKKNNIDSLIMHYITKKIFEEIEETDAYKNKILDSVGNCINEPSEKTKWAYTHLDKFILALKQHIGQEALRDLLSHYDWISDIDPLFIMNMDKNTDFESIRTCLGKLITKMEDTSYLPLELEHKDEYIESDDETLNFSNRASRALTIATFLLYTLRNNTIPTSIDFNSNIIPSVEITFHMCSFGTYDDCLKYCKEHDLISSTDITDNGIRKLVSIAKCIDNGNLLTSKDNRVENQSRNWQKLANIKHD